MRIPPLKADQTVGIVVPARKVDEQLLRKGCEVIKSWGLNVELGKHCFKNDNSYLAATDADRLSDFQSMIDSVSIDAILCARGGYGTTRILDQINFDKLVIKPKWIVGFSDITALHLKLHQLGLESIHGCMPIQFLKPAYAESISSLKSMLFGEQQPVLRAKANNHNRIGIGKGAVVGGNLSLVVDSLGTSTEINTIGKILVLEEIDEKLYKIDRMLTQLKRAGKLSQLAGLVIGHFTDVTDTELPFGQSVEELIMDKVSDYSFCTAFGFPIGHEAPNLAWKHGGIASIAVSTEGSALKFE
jgi:muramoyltetrapeptide carboxypeptidase